MKITQEELDYQEAYKELQEEFPDILYKLELYLDHVQIDEHYFDSVSNLYLLFSQLKGQARYLKLQEVVEVCSVLEEACLVLKHRKPPIKQDMVDWLLMIEDHVKVWKDEINEGMTSLMPLDSYTLSMIKTASVSTAKSKDVLAKLTVLLVEDSDPLREKLKSFLNPRVRKIYTAKNPQSVIKSIEKFRPDIIITSTEFANLDPIKFINEVKSFYKDVPFIVIGPRDLDTNLANALERIPVDKVIKKPLNAKDLLEKIWQIAKIFYEEKWVKIADKELNRYIQDLKPLDTTVKEVRRISLDKEATTKDLSDVINTDPIMTSQVLKAVNSPLYGFRQEINAIGHGVSMLGKEKVTALILQNSFSDAVGGKLDLSAYTIDESTFYEVAKKRMDLMTFWFAKVSLTDLSLLSTSALLGNLGQVLISKEVEKRDIKTEFAEKVAGTHNPKVAEAEFFNTTTEDVTADILAYWGLENSLVNSIRFSHDLTSAPGDIKHLCIANYVVYNTIPLISPKINEDTVNSMKEFLEEMNFQSAHYMRAIDKIM